MLSLTECHCDYTPPCFSRSLVVWGNITCGFQCWQHHPPSPSLLSHQVLCCQNQLTFPKHPPYKHTHTHTLTHPSRRSQSVLHEITRWHGCCPGNHGCTTVAWSPSTNKPRTQQGFAENKQQAWEGWNRRLEGGSGVKGHTAAAAALPQFNLMKPSKMASLPGAQQRWCRTEDMEIRTLERKQILQTHY